MKESEAVALPAAVTAVPLHLTVDPWWDYLCALAFGRVSDGWPPDCRLVTVADEVAFLLDGPDGPVVGFEIWGWNDWAGPSLDDAELWEGPRFDVPRLGLVQATAGEILIAARAAFPEGHATLDAAIFQQATAEEDPERALELWESCLEAGDPKAHFGWGYTLLGAGRPHEAYAHLRRYTELTPANAWAWHWRGQACEALGERAEAAACYRRAMACEAAGGHPTDADERLAALGDD